MRKRQIKKNNKQKISKEKVKGKCTNCNSKNLGIAKALNWNGITYNSVICYDCFKKHDFRKINNRTLKTFK